MADRKRKMALLARRKLRVRKKIKGTPERPRISVFRSLTHIYAQIIDDTRDATLVSASSAALKVPGGNIEGAKAVGRDLAEKARQKGISKVCLDRNGRLYHGRVKALAEAAREAGLEF